MIYGTLARLERNDGRLHAAIFLQRPNNFR